MLYSGWVNQLPHVPLAKIVRCCSCTWLTQPLYGIITYQCSRLLVDHCNRKVSEYPQTVQPTYKMAGWLRKTSVHAALPVLTYDTVMRIRICTHLSNECSHVRMKRINA